MVWLRRFWRLPLALGLAGLAWAPVSAQAAAPLPLGPGTVGGAVNPYVVKRRDSLRGIASRFGVHPVRVAKPSARELRNGLAAGETIYVDQRRILPHFGELSGVVLNIPEAQVYLVDRGRLVREYPVAVSTSTWPMPIGRTRVVSKKANPTWFVPASIQAEMARQGRPVITSLPPGPQNPLGPRWIGLWNDGVGLHGTNAPTSIKHYASHGCVRFFAHDIKDLYDRVGIGTPVHVLYQPVELAVEGASIWLAAYPDVYGRRYDYVGAVKSLAAQAGVASRLDWAAVRRAIRTADGILVEVGQAGGPVAPSKPRKSPRPTPTPTEAPLLDPTLDDELQDIPPEWLIERSPDPWYTSP